MGAQPLGPRDFVPPEAVPEQVAAIRGRLNGGAGCGTPSHVAAPGPPPLTPAERMPMPAMTASPAEWEAWLDPPAEA